MDFNTKSSTGEAIGRVFNNKTISEVVKSNTRKL